MVKLTCLDGREIVINARLIKFVESTPDTVITLTTRDKILVRESVDEVIKKVIAYYRFIENFSDS
ncbi:flagellar FlbD family protein [Candidatus Aerophobetes bacterium]|nr:flagellar FlbD family protein [Candidatus Aerophobetes bacterium]